MTRPTAIRPLIVRPSLREVLTYPSTLRSLLDDARPLNVRLAAGIATPRSWRQLTLAGRRAIYFATGASTINASLDRTSRR